jgi:hypothetical protein
VVTLGRVLVAAGVAIWPVWGTLFLLDRAPHVALAIGAHLALVIPGGMILRAHRPEAQRRARGRRLGEVLILLGVLAWAPYFILSRDGEVESWPFLAAHLSGVIPGAVLRYTPLGDRVLPTRSGAPAAEAPGQRDT